MEALKTQLYDTHVKAGAKMVPFAGFEMPVRYTTIQEEHMAVRQNAGLFDVSHMGEFVIMGKGALELIQQISSNDASKLVKGQAQYTCIPNENGGIVDDMIVYCLEPNPENPEFLLVVNAGNIAKDWAWISNYNTYGAKMIDRSEQTGLLALQGPKAINILQELTDVDLKAIKFYHFEIGSIGHIPDVIISATGYTGSGGFELYVDNKYLDDLWALLMRKGKTHGLVEAGLGARDTLRLEMGYCLYGNDITDETSPISAGLSWIVKTKKDSFNSKDIFIKEKKEGTQRRLVGFELAERRIPRNGYEILSVDDKVIGSITSGSMSPMLDKPIAMGYIDVEYKEAGTAVKISTGRKNLDAKVCKAPFVQV